MKKRLLALLMAAIMVLSLAPATAFADDEDAGDLLARYNAVVESGDEDIINEFRESLTEEQYAALMELIGAGDETDLQADNDDDPQPTPPEDGDGDSQIATQADGDKVIFVPVDELNHYDVRINGEGPVVTIYCLQQQYIWPDKGITNGNKDVEYEEKNAAADGEYNHQYGVDENGQPIYYDHKYLLSDDEVQIIRKLIYAGYPTDSQGYVRELWEAMGMDTWGDSEFGFSPYYACGEYTNQAIWTLMNEWGKPGSVPNQSFDYDNLNDPPSKYIAALLRFAKGSDSIEPPASSTILIDGSGTLVKNGNTWTTGDLQIKQPVGYNLMFELNLPDGVTAVDVDGNTVTSVEENQVFRIVANSADGINGTKLTATAVAKYPTDVTFYLTNEYRRKDNGNKDNDYQTMLYIQEETMNLTGTLDLAIADMGGFSVTKTVSGDGADLTKAFDFSVELSDKTINGLYGEMDFTNGAATLRLKNGETKTALYLPAGITYTVTEADYTDANYVATFQNNTGTIVKDTTIAVTFSNVYTNPDPSPEPSTTPNPKTGALSISKTVKGDLGDKTKLFTFTVTFDADGTYSYTGSRSGTIKSGGTVQLMHGDSITITGLPEGTSYTIVESDNDGYIVDKTNDTGKISADKTTLAGFTNTKSSVPKAGDDRNFTQWVLVMLVSAAGLLTAIVFASKKRKVGKHEAK